MDVGMAVDVCVNVDVDLDAEEVFWYHFWK